MKHYFRPILKSTAICAYILCKSTSADSDNIEKKNFDHVVEGRNPNHITSIISSIDDCENVACVDKKDAMMRSFAGLNLLNSSSNQPKSSDEDKESALPCPLDREELGRSSWDLIHTLAANFPENPSEEEKLMAFNFAEAIAHLFPCKICARDFEKSFKKSPLSFKSRVDLVLWWCERHNEVNRKLGKPEFKCDIKLLDKRWKKGDSNCIER